MAEPTYEYIVMTGQYIPARWKTVALTDTKIIYNKRVLKKGLKNVPIITSNKLFTIIDPLESRQVLIQSVSNEIIEIEISFKENELIEIIELAEKIQVTDENGIIYDCIFESSNKETNISETTLGMFTLTLLKRDQDANIVNTYVDKAFIERKYVDYNYVKFTNNVNIDDIIDFEGGEELIFKTIFMPVYRRSEMVANAVDIENGNTIINNSFDYEEIIFKFFLTDSELLQLKKYGQRCFYNNNGTFFGCEGYDITNGISVSQSNVKIEIQEQENLINLNEVNLTITKDYTNFYHLS